MTTTDNQNTPETVNDEPTGRATYCPEDNKLRLYIGRVPRDEFLKLRAEGWTTLHKQREAGGGDFVATWTPDRRDTALEYAGVIEDEDMGPAERAADRAERFAGYRDKRSNEAIAGADRYDAQPSAYGFQSQARAERAARRFDRVAARAVDAWDRADYWTQRTAGVIAHALHVSTPSVRMGRIKELEAEARKIQKTREDQIKKWNLWEKVAAITDTEKQNAAALSLSGYGYDWHKYTHPRTGEKGSLWDLMREDKPDRITGAEACALYFAARINPLSEAWHDTRAGDWAKHFAHRLAYENQMIEAQGGRAAFVEMEAGGWLYGGRHMSKEWRRIIKVNKSNATGRVVSVDVVDNHPSSRNHWGNPFPDGITKTLVHKVEVERMAPDAYRAPTDEERAAYHAEKAAKKAAEPKKPAFPFVNPTDADAQRLQDIWNQQNKSRFDREPKTVLRMTQSEYSAASSGSYNRAETLEFTGGGFLPRISHMGRDADFPSAGKVRTFNGSVVILTDKPQKEFPAQVWHDPRPETRAEVLTHWGVLVAACGKSWFSDLSKLETDLFYKAAKVGLAYVSSLTQFGLTEAGHQITKQHGAQPRVLFAEVKQAELAL